MEIYYNILFYPWKKKEKYFYFLYIGLYGRVEGIYGRYLIFSHFFNIEDIEDMEYMEDMEDKTIL